jgi:hypothetical protein
MATNLRELHCNHVSVSEAGDGFQVLFAKAQDSDEAYVLVQRHFEFPDRGECYVETEDREFCGHFAIRTARLSRNCFKICFGRASVRKHLVFFNVTDSVYAEIQRVLKIMIPEIEVTPDGSRNDAE